MAGLTPPERFAIGMIEGTDLFKAIDPAVIGTQATSLQSRFKGIPDVTLARMLLTMAVGLETAIMISDDPEVQVQSCKAYCTEIQILAAAVTRKERGLPPLGVNGAKEETVDSFKDEDERGPEEGPQE